MSAGWTGGMVRQLTELWDEGLSCAQIARAIGGGISRCAVMGKVNRLGLNKRKGVPRAVPRPQYNRNTPTVRHNIVKMEPGVAPEFICAPATFAGADACHFIQGDTAGHEWQMCGQPGHPWCDYHRSICYDARRTEASQKAAELSAKSDAIARRVGLG